MNSKVDGINREREDPRQKFKMSKCVPVFWRCIFSIFRKQKTMKHSLNLPKKAQDGSEENGLFHRIAKNVIQFGCDFMVTCGATGARILTFILIPNSYYEAFMRLFFLIYFFFSFLDAEPPVTSWIDTNF